jgi:hypothetical protein
MRQVVDWSAAMWAGLVAGTVFLLLLLFVNPIFSGGNSWVVIRLLASLVLGAQILAPPATFNLGALLVGLITHYILSLGFVLLLAYIIHRWGLIVGLVGGALFGLALYATNFYTLTLFFPWFYAMRSWPVVISHIIFGAVAGAVYESLEVETFVPVEE